MDWLKNLNAAIEYIEENLDGELCYEEAAAVACCSPYYFQRIFSWVVGISLAEYIRRRRMSQAAFDLQRGKERVSDIALKYGYSSPTSFHRAFHSVHGISPTAAKKRETVLKTYPPARFSVEVTGDKVLNYRIVKRDAMRIAGMCIRLAEDMEENRKRIPGFWKEMMENEQLDRIGRLSREEPGVVLGVSVYENRDNIFYYIAAATDREIPADMCAYEIPASTWVIFEQEGDFRREVQEVFRRFHKEWLLFSAYEYAGLPDIEAYPLRAGEPGSGRSQVWISIQEKEAAKRHRGGNL